MTPINIRPMRQRDLQALLDILDRTGMFTPEEIDVAVELLDIWLNRPEQKDYIIYAAEQEDEHSVLGYVCYGPTPATKQTFDLYWIAVEPRRQRSGIGKQLLDFAERECHSRGGRLMVIETSSTAKYSPTRKFYQRNGYVSEARIKDFYAPGDDRLIFTKRLPECFPD